MPIENLKRFSRASPRMRSLAPKPNLLAAIALAVGFVLFQAWTAGYGTKINQIRYIRDYQVSPEALAGSALDRPFVVDRERVAPENLDKWMLRFKLYSVDADEMMMVMALARIHPAEGQFDPHLYQYGGAWLYPLGGWFALLNKIGVLKLGSLSTMLSHPNRMNDVYRFGRLFVTLAVAVAGIFLFAAICETATLGAALAGEALFFLCPATISFSLTMKPHWYALLFVNIALFVMVRAVRGSLPIVSEISLGVVIGLAVGSAVSFGSFSVLIWFGLVLLVWRRTVSAATLVRVPLVAAISFVLTNPFLFVDWAAARAETAQTAGWYAPTLNWTAVDAFAWNSFLPGFGVPLALLLIFVSWRVWTRPSEPILRFASLGVWAALLLAAALTANMSYWNVNYRYAAYALPASILLISAAKWPGKTAGLVVVLLLTALQATPIKLAMIDENDPAHGTRLAAAQWIDDHIPPGMGVCLGTPTPVPFDTPPFDMSRYKINASDCSFRVQVESYHLHAAPPAGYTVAEEFRPRLSPSMFALVFGHINPRIAIYRRI